MSNSQDVLITGIGVVSPIGIGAGAFWDALIEGKSGITDLSREDCGESEMNFGGLLQDFDPKAYVRPRKSLKVMCREIQTAFSASLLAVEDAGLDLESVDKHRVGTVFGSEMLYGDPGELTATALKCTEDGEINKSRWGGVAMREVYPLWMLRYLPNMAACHVGIAIGALGPNNTMVMGETSGLSALGEAIGAIERGIADVVVVCSTGTRVSHTRLLYRGAYPYASRRDPVCESSRPFAEDRDGVAGGEGAGAIILESAKHAAGRGAAPIARVAGFSSNYCAPAGRRSDRALRSAVEQALSRSGIDGEDIPIAISHATGDIDSDRCDAEVHRQLTPAAMLHAPKAAIGHCGAGCGILELSVATMALRESVVPPTVNAASLDQSLGIELAQRATPVTANAVLQSSHSLQGHGVAVVLAQPQ